MRVYLFPGSFDHHFAQAHGRFHAEMVAIESQFLNQLVVDHHVERHPAAFFAQALQLLQRMDGQRAQIVLHPSVALQHDMLHLPVVRMRNAHNVVEIMIEVHPALHEGNAIVLRARQDAVQRETSDKLVLQDLV